MVKPLHDSALSFCSFFLLTPNIASEVGGKVVGILDHVLVELGLNVGIRHVAAVGVVSPPERRAVGAAATNVAKVVAVGRRVEASGAGVAREAGVSLADDNVAGRVVLGGGGAVGQPVLGRGVAVVEQDRGQTGHGVVEVGDAVLGAGLIRHVGDKGPVANTGAAVGVNVDRVAVLAVVGSTNSGNGGAERVASVDNAVRRVGRLCGSDSSGDNIRNLEPSGIEASVEQTAGRDITQLLDEDQAVRFVSLKPCVYVGGLFFSTYSVIQFRTECEPRNETTMTLFVASVDTNP